MPAAIFQVLRVALPLMISTGLFSVTLFVDRTLLLWHDGQSMSASMAAGSLFWVLTCLPMGILSMTGAIVSQYVGSGRPESVGRFLWQAIWVSLAFIPWFGWIAYSAPDLFRLTGQDPSLIEAESIYLRWLLIGATGTVLETCLSGFFSGTERTGTILVASIGATVLNLVGDVVMIFGLDSLGPIRVGIPSLGIAGAAIASSLSFWFKAIVYAALILGRNDYAERYQTRRGFGWDRAMVTKLFYFGLPAGLMFVTEAGAFTFIVLRIGSLGDLPLRATTMAINFNMIAFIPLMGVSIAASVLVGRHLTESGPAEAAKMAKAALIVGWVYSGLWAIAYVTGAEWMLSLYRIGESDPLTEQAITIARGLLIYVACYVFADSTQLVLASVLRGAGDTWFVLLAGFVAGVAALILGCWGDPLVTGSAAIDSIAGGSSGTVSSATDSSGTSASLNWWWQVILIWIWLICGLMTIRFLGGRWRSMRMVGDHG